MINVSIARRYARALLAVALQSGRADEVLGELDLTVGAMTESPQVRDLFRSPGFSREGRHAFVAELSKKAGFAEPTISFLKLLVDRGRVEHIEQVTRIYRQLADEAAGRIRAEIFTPRPLDTKSKERLTSAISKITKKKIQLEERVDEDLMGGLVVQVGDRVYDGSLKTQLKRIRETALS